MLVSDQTEGEKKPLLTKKAFKRRKKLSIITDQCIPETLVPAELETIIATAGRAEPRLTALVRGVLERL